MYFMLVENSLNPSIFFIWLCVLNLLPSGWSLSRIEPFLRRSVVHLHQAIVKSEVELGLVTCLARKSARDLAVTDSESSVHVGYLMDIDSLSNCCRCGLPIDSFTPASLAPPFALVSKTPSTKSTDSDHAAYLPGELVHVQCL
ncbi:unnamed protein product [Protopolystoma xenopodis]|uniref:Uncharacterized protein n=1 Tax=Protopolystoma xenopodis TaxID=117903 RepID=A0A448XAG9_9PLAT|nr:unnamed protein product [Protopolystoma xenopodis]